MNPIVALWLDLLKRSMKSSQDILWLEVEHFLWFLYKFAFKILLYTSDCTSDRISNFTFRAIWYSVWFDWTDLLPLFLWRLKGVLWRSMHSKSPKILLCMFILKFNFSCQIVCPYKWFPQHQSSLYPHFLIVIWLWSG